MKRKYYIAYGSNLDVDQMLHRCPDALTIGRSTIDGYKLVFRGNSRSGVANIEPCDGASVPVGIWSISPSDEDALDGMRASIGCTSSNCSHCKYEGRR